MSGIYTNIEFCAVTTTSTSSPICSHKNGWYGKVSFWLFNRRIFMCSDCGKLLVGKELHKFRKKKEWRDEK